MASFMTQVRDMFSTLTAKKGDGVVGIDIGASSIKVVQLRTEREQVVLETYGMLSLGPTANQDEGTLVSLSDEDLGAAVKRVLTEARVTATRTVVTLPLSQALTVVLKLPRVSDKDLSMVIETEARKYIPVPLTDVVMDSFEIPAHSDTPATEREVLVVALPRDIVNRMEAVMTSIGRKAEAMEVEIFSAMRAGLDRDLAPVLFIDVGASGARAAVVELGVVRRTASFPRGGAQATDILARAMNLPFADAERKKREAPHDALRVYIDELVRDVDQFARDAEADVKSPAARVVMTGGGSSLPGLRDALEKQLGVTVSLADPFDKSKAPEFLRPTLKLSGPTFAHSLGAALRSLIY
jgi:type IV pilus assembly protein PilM